MTGRAEDSGRSAVDAGPLGQSDDAFIRRIGRPFITALYGALRAIRLYPVENVAVQKALDEVSRVAGEIVHHDQELEFRLSGEFLFINGTRLRLDLDNYASFSHLLSLFREAGVGSLVVTERVEPREWLVLLSLLQNAARAAGEDRLAALRDRLAAAGVHRFDLGPPADKEEDPESQAAARAAARRTYTQSVAVTKDVINSVRMGRAPSIRKIKRVVQTIVDQVLNDETSLIGMTNLRDYDEYTFTHSVNVCIFSVALGRRLGFSKLQLYDLGIAALLHDIGKSRVPVEFITKPGGLDESEWRAVSAHPWLGALELFRMRGQQELPYRSIVVAFEHHMKIDLTGYPRTVRPRQLSLFSKIVAVADSFDAATSRRSYQTEPWSPAAVLREMRDNKRRGMDPVIVKSFINLTGIYPVGTLVVLDTFELGVVDSAGTSPDALSRPVVRLVSDTLGNIVYDGPLVDLTVQNPDGTFARSIIKTADPDKYGINVGDFFG